ncbi:BglG family transcription antiterminator [Ligilactobacillus salivarius]|uniref:BglG family transcription antiterminator n=1 Tax=Ligilactobacillus salivarius TaxID=1624 RepID=UPI0024BB2FF4|nr:HTH domain-containing protein [Ligilactobacillus salivarius]
MNVLNYQLFKILTTNDSITVDRLVSELQVSKKTLQKYITSLNEELGEIAEIQEKNQKYYLKVEDYARLAKFQTHYLKTTLDFNNPLKRQAYILLMLIKSKGYMLLDDLSEYLMVSKGTINRDIKEIKLLLKDYDTTIRSVSNNGVMLESKADCQIAFILRNFVCDYYDLGEKLAIEEKQEITKLVRKYDKSKTVRNLIIRHLKILNFLHEHGRKISTTPDCYYELTSSEVNDEIISILKKYLHSEEITEAEKSFLLIPLNINYSNRNTERINKRLMWIDELFAEIFSQVKENISLDIDYNRVFEQIKYHSIFMINRSATYMRNDDLFSREIVEKYPVAVDLAIMTVNLLESKLHIKISDKELGYLALYYQMEIEDEKRGNSQYHKVAIVGEVSKSIQNLIISRLNETFQGTTEADIFKSSESFKKSSERYLIVFSTLPLESKDVTTPIVRIQSIFKNDELVSKVTLSQVMAGISSQQVKFRIQRFEERISYLKAVENLIDTEISTGELLPGFKLDWKKREEKMSNVFQNGIAIPHMVDKSNHSRILLTVGILSKAVKYQGKEVRIIFLIGIPQNLNSKLSKILSHVYDLIFMISGYDEIYNNLLEYDMDLPLTQITEGI